ncbi:MAG: hypothetical protein SGILL_005345 [Bacillariaceae sp.]
MPPTSNKSNADVDGGSSGATPRDLYEAGNPEASLNLLVENAIQRRRQDSNKKIAREDSSSDVRPPSAPFHTLQEEYNSSILTALMADPPTHDVTMFQDTLEPIEQAIFKSNGASTTTLKTEREQLIIVHNEAVAFLASGDVHDAIEVAWKHLCPFLDTTPNSPTNAAVKVPDELLRLACRLGFVLLDGLLMLWPQRRHNPEQVYKTNNGDGGGDDSPLLNIELIVTWLNDMVVDKELGDRDPQLKFLLSLYKSRVDFHERDHCNKIPEANIRSARKELKQAMEVFQHKLRVVSNDSGSLASSSYSAEDLHSGRSSGAKSPTPLSMSNSSGGGNNNNSSNMPRVLQHQNQAVLNLKANAEQLKTNMKKSLILCAEANNHDAEEGLDDDNNNGEKNAYYEAIHQNNLGIVYETSGKPYLALHAFAKALRLSTTSSHDRQSGDNHTTGASSAALFETNGTARPDMTLNILHNTGISSLKAGNYLGAYKCFAILLREGCNVWATRPRTWLRLAEACIGKTV